MSEFQEMVFAVVREIPSGETRTYGEIGKAIGKPTAGKAVGQALMGLDLDSDIPWWRCTMTDGLIVGDPIDKILSRLADEGVEVSEDRKVSRAKATRSRERRMSVPVPCWKHETVQFTCRDCAPRGA